LSPLIPMAAILSCSYRRLQAPAAKVIGRIRVLRRTRPGYRPRPSGDNAGRNAYIAITHGSRSKATLSEKGRPRLPGRRLVLHFPRLSCAAAAQPQVRRTAAQCGARLLQHAVEAVARHEAGGAAY